jgi:hypothetical protein
MVDESGLNAVSLVYGSQICYSYFIMIKYVDRSTGVNRFKE